MKLWCEREDEEMWEREEGNLKMYWCAVRSVKGMEYGPHRDAYQTFLSLLFFFCLRGCVAGEITKLSKWVRFACNFALQFASAAPLFLSQRFLTCSCQCIIQIICLCLFAFIIIIIIIIAIIMVVVAP